MSRIAEAFQNAKNEQRLALIGYLPAGYPTPERFCELAICAFAAGLDILEIGLPSRNPIFDGRVIREAIAAAVQRGTDTLSALRQSQQVLAATQGAAVLMFYRDVLAQIPYPTLLEHSRRAGFSGHLLVNVPLAEWLTLAEAAKAAGMDAIGFVSAGFDEQAIQQVSRAAGGFLYIQSRDAPTGSPAAFDEEVRRRIARIRRLCEAELPLAVGFGVRAAEDVESIRQMGAQGVIVGTAFVEAAAQGCAAVQDLIGSLRLAAIFS